MKDICNECYYFNPTILDWNLGYRCHVHGQCPDYTMSGEEKDMYWFTKGVDVAKCKSAKTKVEAMQSNQDTLRDQSRLVREELLAVIDTLDIPATDRATIMRLCVKWNALRKEADECEVARVNYIRNNT